MLFADLHIHSKYSRATSSHMDIKHLSIYGKMKGLNIIGTGDITHPLWREEIKKETDYLENGIFKSKYNDMRFVLSSEISTIYSQDKKIRRIHHLVIFPDLEVVESFIDKMRSFLLSKGKKCNLKSDGRPIIGMSSIDLAELLFSTSKDILLVPAHIWTPWFGLFGEMSGFDTIEECYGEYSKRIYAVETGLSSDPPMNWRYKDIKDKLLISNSDCHSPFVNRIGRECNAFDRDIEDFDYKTMHDDIKNKNLKFTVEVDPSYGKYHFDGHRKCNIVMSPEQAEEHNNICPVCKRPLTKGVLHRVEQLTNFNKKYLFDKQIPFEYHIPLIEILSILLNKGINTKYIYNIYKDLIKKYDNEFNIMFNISIDEINKDMFGLGTIIQSLREKRLRVEPGYDGVYGKPIIKSEQKNIFDY